MNGKGIYGGISCFKGEFDEFKNTQIAMFDYLAGWSAFKVLHIKFLDITSKILLISISI